MSLWKALFLDPFLLCAACPVQAQSEYRRYEVTPLFGTRFGGTIDLTQHGHSKVENGMDQGVLARITFWQNFQGEFMRR
jgi:hypothetical protein